MRGMERLTLARPLATATLLFVTIAAVVTGCGADAESENARPTPSNPPTTTTTDPVVPTATSESTSTTAPTPNPAPSTAATSSPPEPESVDAKDLLVRRDDGGIGNWGEEDPDVPEPPAYTSDPTCTDLTNKVFDTAQSEDEAAIGWFDSSSNNVLYSGQAIRVYPSANEAAAAMQTLRTTVSECSSWTDGNKAPGSWQYKADRWGAYGLPKDNLPWRAQVHLDGIDDADTSTWYITVRYDNVVSTVASTSPDDVAKQGQKDARIFADQAGRAILEAQGY